MECSFLSMLYGAFVKVEKRGYEYGLWNAFFFQCYMEHLLIIITTLNSFKLFLLVWLGCW